MKAYFYDEESLGSTYQEEEIPQDLKGLAKEYHDKMLESVAEFDDELMHDFVHGGNSTEERIMRAIRKGTLRVEFVPVFCGAASRTRVPEAHRRRDRLSPVASRCAAGQGINPIRKRKKRDSATTMSVRRAGVQDPDGSIYREAYLHPRVQRNRGDGKTTSTSIRVTKSVLAGSFRCTRTSAKSARSSMPATSPRWWV